MIRTTLKAWYLKLGLSESISKENIHYLYSYLPVFKRISKILWISDAFVYHERLFCHIAKKKISGKISVTNQIDIELLMAIEFYEIFEINVIFSRNEVHAPCLLSSLIYFSKIFFQTANVCVICLNAMIFCHVHSGK